MILSGGFDKFSALCAMHDAFCVVRPRSWKIRRDPPPCVENFAFFSGGGFVHSFSLFFGKCWEIFFSDDCEVTFGRWTHLAFLCHKYLYFAHWDYSWTVSRRGYHAFLQYYAGVLVVLFFPFCFLNRRIFLHRYSLSQLILTASFIHLSNKLGDGRIILLPIDISFPSPVYIILNRFR